MGGWMDGWIFPLQQLHVLPSNRQCFCRGSFSLLGTSVREISSAFHSIPCVTFATSYTYTSTYCSDFYINMSRSPLSTHPLAVHVTLCALNKSISIAVLQNFFFFFFFSEYSEYHPKQATKLSAMCGSV